MSLVDISAGDVQEYHGTKVPAKARLYANEQFTTDDGIVVAKGSRYKRSFAQEFTASLVGTAIRVASGNAYSTTNSNRPTADYTLVIYDTLDREICVVYRDLRIPDVPTPTTWAALELYSAGDPVILPNTYPTFDQLNALLNALVNPVLKASDVIIGATELDTVPADLLVPIAVGANSNRVMKNLSSDYGNDFATAIAAIGASEITLVVKNPVAVAADVTLPSNITLDVRGEGLITISGNKTMTIASMTEAPNKQLFATGAGTNAITFGKGATPYINLAWWAGKTPPSDAHWAMTQALASLTAGEGGRLLIPPGNWKVTGGYDLPSNTVIEGVGTSFGADKGSQIELLTNASYIFRVIGDQKNITLHNLTLHTASTTGSYAFGIVNANAAINVVGVFLDHVVFACDGAVSDYNVFIDGNGTTEMEQISFHQCMFLGAKKDCLYINTVNGSFTLESPYFYQPNSPAGAAPTLLGNAVHLVSCGIFKMSNHTALGISAGATCSGGIPNTAKAGAVILVDGDHITLDVINGQDEGYGYFLYNNHSQSDFPINLFGVQCNAQNYLNANCQVNVIGGNYAASAFKAGAAVAATVFGYGEYVQTTNYCGTAGQPSQLCDFAGTNSVHLVDISAMNGYSRFKHQIQYIDTAVTTQSATRPMVTISSNAADVGLNDKYLLYIGETDSDGVPTNGYAFYRRNSDGALIIHGTQVGNEAINFNGPISSSAIRCGSKQSTHGVGYATGAGAAVTQITSLVTTVVCNGMSGAITMFAASGLAAGAQLTFQVDNSSVEIGDVIVLSIQSGPTADTVFATVTSVTAGHFKVTLHNGGAVADTGTAPVINFAVIKAVSA